MIDFKGEYFNPAKPAIPNGRAAERNRDRLMDAPQGAVVKVIHGSRSDGIDLSYATENSIQSR